MDGATIHAKVYAGRGKAAKRIGMPCEVYRPFVGADPMGNKVATLPAAFNSGDNRYASPNEPGDAMWHADYDGRLTQVGDYLKRVSDGNVWFVAGQQPLLPIIVVDCNRSVRVSRLKQGSAVGVAPYGGVTDATEEDIIGAPRKLWPASILFGGRTEKTAVAPMTSKMAGWRILLPVSVPATINAGDVITDDLGRRYLVDGAEGTESLWRINAQELHQ